LGPRDPILPGAEIFRKILGYIVRNELVKVGARTIVWARDKATETLMIGVITRGTSIRNGPDKIDVLESVLVEETPQRRPIRVGVRRQRVSERHDAART
jgi:hypothetical protein